VGSDAAGIAEAAQAAPPRIPSKWPRIGIARPMLDAKSCGKTVDGSLPGPRTLAVLDEIWVHSQCQKMASRVDVLSASRLGQAKHANNNRIRANRRITPDHSAAARVTPGPRGKVREKRPRRQKPWSNAIVFTRPSGPARSSAARAAHNRFEDHEFLQTQTRTHATTALCSVRIVAADATSALLGKSHTFTCRTGCDRRANCRRRSATQPP
jgi:hypothetical protein